MSLCASLHLCAHPHKLAWQACCCLLTPFHICCCCRLFLTLAFAPNSADSGDKESTVKQTIYSIVTRIDLLNFITKKDGAFKKASSE